MNFRVTLLLCSLEIFLCKQYLVQTNEQSDWVDKSEDAGAGNDYQAVMSGYPCNDNFGRSEFLIPIHSIHMSY